MSARWLGTSWTKRSLAAIARNQANSSSAPTVAQVEGETCRVV